MDDVTDYKMSHCTCIADKEITCIVHPTTRSLKDRIAELEAKLERLEEERELISTFVHSDPPFDVCAGVDLYERAAEYSAERYAEESSAEDYYRAFLDCARAALEEQDNGDLLVR